MLREKWCSRSTTPWLLECGRDVSPSRVEAIERLGIGKGSHRREGATYWAVVAGRTAAGASSWVAWPVARPS